jgi:hypothetical protein
MDNSQFVIYSSPQEAEIAHLKEAAKRTYTERFRALMRLIRISSMISNAKIVDPGKTIEL